MNLYEKIKSDRNRSRGVDKNWYNVTTVLLGELERKDKNPSDEVVIAVIQKMIKDAEYSQTVKFEDKVEDELMVYNSYLPAAVPEEDILAMAESVSNIGQFMGMLNKHAKANGMVVDNAKARKIFESINK